jgi:radical SAM protein with 4Fe4S-binding SPASM domain
VSTSILDKVRERNIPLYALIELTYRCNLRCCHCYLPRKKSPNELSADEYKNVLDQLAVAGTLFLTFTGGEVLLREDFFEIATYAKKRNFSIFIFTNGTLVSEGVANKIKEVDPLRVKISIYGKDSKTHDGITNVPGSFRKSIAGIELLKQKGIEVSIKTPLMKCNVGQYKEIISMANKLEVEYELNTVISPKLDRSCEPLSYRINEMQLFEVFSDTVLNPDAFKEKEDVYDYRIREGMPICAAGRNSFVVSYAGIVSPCAMLRIPFGDVKKQPFPEIWHSVEARKIRAIKFTDIKTCTQCELLVYCNRCPGIALLEDGNIFGPARFFCKMARVRKSISERNIDLINQNTRR